MDMKNPRTFRIALLALAAAAMALASVAEELSAAPSVQVKVYYFHRKFRCPSCIEIENLVEKTLKATYANQMAEGRLVWRSIDLSEKENEHFTKDYSFTFNSLIVVESRDGKDVRFKNLEKIFEIYEDQEKASGYVREEVGEYLGK